MIEHSGPRARFDRRLREWVPIPRAVLALALLMPLALAGSTTPRETYDGFECPQFAILRAEDWPTLTAALYRADPAAVPGASVPTFAAYYWSTPDAALFLDGYYTPRFVAHELGHKAVGRIHYAPTAGAPDVMTNPFPARAIHVTDTHDLLPLAERCMNAARHGDDAPDHGMPGSVV